MYFINILHMLLSLKVTAYYSVKRLFLKHIIQLTMHDLVIIGKLIVQSM